MLEYLTRYESWLILGFALIALDMLLGLDFFALAFGVGALLLGAGLAALNLGGHRADWEIIVMAYAIASMAVLIPLRLWLNRSRKESKAQKDINDY